MRLVVFLKTILSVRPKLRRYLASESYLKGNVTPIQYQNKALSYIVQFDIASFRPETPDVKLPVSVLESGDFFSWQGNRGVARRRTLVRRTSKTED